ncbi:MAG: phosphonate ABC transporter, permease protein PhnE [Roseococcus sp.]|nr:phosphonate ABC transporter, permease protein PhnE [Roseococcus sp.]
MTDRPAPPRLERPSPLAFALLVGAAALVLSSFQGVGFSLAELWAGLPQMARILGEMLPPAHDRWDRVLASLIETFHMALAGTLLGVLLSVPLAVLACRALTPSWPLRAAARSLIALFRTVPDLVWALLFVVAVGLGPFAGTLALMVDTMGYAARFFAEAMEEQDKGPQEALAAAGAPRSGLLMAAVLPAALPSMVATSLFCLEKATRGGVVLGLVGAGGIGMELKVAMDLFNYAEAAASILAILLLVVAVEQAAAALRRRIIG